MLLFGVSRADVATKSMSACDRCGQSTCPQDQQADPVDTGEDQDGVVFAKVLIGDNGTEDGRDCLESISRILTRDMMFAHTIAEPLEEEVEACSALVA